MIDEGGFPRASQTRFASQREVLDMAGMEGLDEDDLADALDEAEEEDEREEEVLRASQVVRDEEQIESVQEPRRNGGNNGYQARVEDESEIIWDTSRPASRDGRAVEPEFEEEAGVFDGDTNGDANGVQSEEEVVSEGENEFPATQRNSGPQVRLQLFF